MKLKTEVEEVHFLGADGYRAIVRVNRYEKSDKSATLQGVVFHGPDEKAETPAEFRITLPRGKAERPIADIKRDAIAAVLQLCREITSNLEPKPKTEH